MWSWRRLGATILVALIAAAAVLRAIGLNDGLWFDEIITLVLFVRPPLERIVTEYPNSNNHPLYSILAHEWPGVRRNLDLLMSRHDGDAA